MPPVPPPPPRLARRFGWALLLAAILTTVPGCGFIKGKAIGMVAESLSSTGSVFSGDNDPQLIRDATPFALKMYESLLESVPRNKDLLVATCGAFTQYAYAFLEGDADVMGEARHDEAKALRARALNLYLRAKDYCLRGMEVRFKGISMPLIQHPEIAVKKATNKKDVPLLYWTAASWGAAISLRPDDLGIDFPVVRALMTQALALDDTWDSGSGALHETMITIESLGDALGGSEERARQQFARAVELQHGLAPGPYIALAMGVSKPKGDRAEFEKLLKQALDIDPEKDKNHRLVTMIMQRRAKALLDRADELFVAK